MNRLKIARFVALAAQVAVTLADNASHYDATNQKTFPIKVAPGIDGNNLGINGYEVKTMLYIVKQIKRLLHGVMDHTTKKFTGVYTFNGNPHSISSLAFFEQQHPHMPAAMRDELKLLLEKAKNDFIKIAEPFVLRARGVKMITIKFIEEWAEHHNKKNSAVLHWSKEKDGKEFDTFKAETTSFILLEDFCNDLVSFISDLIQSCPRAWEQFMALQAHDSTKK